MVDAWAARLYNLPNNVNKKNQFRARRGERPQNMAGASVPGPGIKMEETDRRGKND